MTKSIIELIGREKTLKLMSDATAKAAEKSRQMGLPETVNIDDVLYENFRKIKSQKYKNIAI